MTYGTKPSIAVPSPETYVKNALNTLGYSRRSTGYWSHAIQVMLTNKVKTSDPNTYDEVSFNVVCSIWYGRREWVWTIKNDINRYTTQDNFRKKWDLRNVLGTLGAKFPKCDSILIFPPNSPRQILLLLLKQANKQVDHNFLMAGHHLRQFHGLHYHPPMS